MDLTLISLTVGWCRGCALFKEKHRDKAFAFLRNEGVSVREIQGPTRDGKYPSPVPEFIRSITFYPCFILIDSELLRKSGEMSPDEVLPYVTIMCGSVEKAGDHYTVRYNAPCSETTTVEGFQRLIQRHNAPPVRTKSPSRTSFQCRAINPVNRSYG